MVDHVTFEMPDFKALQAELLALPQRMQERVLKGAVATGASVISKAAISLAPMWTGTIGKKHPPPGTLKGAIYQTRLVDQCTPTYEAWKIDVRSGKRLTAKGNALPDAYYAKWIEYGHFTRTPKGAGPIKARRKQARASGAARWVPPQPFMRPAFDAGKDAALKAMDDYIKLNLPAATAANRFLKAA